MRGKKIEEGLTPLLNALSCGYLGKGLKGMKVMIRRCSYHNSLPLKESQREAEPLLYN